MLLLCLYLFYFFLPKEVIEEVDQFKAALRKYFSSKNQTCVMFERNFRSQHLQIQVEQGLVKGCVYIVHCTL